MSYGEHTASGSWAAGNRTTLSAHARAPKIPAAFDDIQASAVDDKPDAPKAVIERIIAILSHAHSD